MANITESRPAFVQDITGRENIVYQDVNSSQLVHARYDSNAQEWVDAQVLPYDNQPVYNLKLLAADEIVPTGNQNDPFAPGLVLLWQEKADNNADLYYSVGRFTNTGDVAWSDAVQLETDVDGQPVADLNFDAAIIKDNNGNPEIVIVEQRLNPNTVDPDTGITTEDADLYYITLKSDELDLVFETPTTPAADVDPPGAGAQLPFVEVVDETSLDGGETRVVVAIPPLVAEDGTVFDEETLTAALLEQLSNLSAADQQTLKDLTLKTSFDTGFTYTFSLGSDGNLSIGAGPASFKVPAEPFIKKFFTSLGGGEDGFDVELSLAFKGNLGKAKINQPDGPFFEPFATVNGTLSLSFDIYEEETLAETSDIESLPVTLDAEVSRQRGLEFVFSQSETFNFKKGSDNTLRLTELDSLFSVTADYYDSISAKLDSGSLLQAKLGLKAKVGAVLAIGLNTTYSADSDASQQGLNGSPVGISFGRLIDKNTGEAPTTTTPASDIEIIFSPSFGNVALPDTLSETPTPESNSKTLGSFAVTPFLSATAKGSAGSTIGGVKFTGIELSATAKTYIAFVVAEDKPLATFGVDLKAAAQLAGVIDASFELKYEKALGKKPKSQSDDALQQLEVPGPLSTFPPFPTAGISLEEPEVTLTYFPIPGTTQDYSVEGLVTAVPALSPNWQNPTGQTSGLQNDSPSGVTDDTFADGPPALALFRNNDNQVLLAWSKSIPVAGKAADGSNLPPSSFILLNLLSGDQGGLFWEASAAELDLGSLPLDNQGEGALATTSSLNFDPALGIFEAANGTVTNVVVWQHQTATEVTSQANATPDNVQTALENTEIRYSYQQGQQWDGSWSTPQTIVSGFKPGAQISNLTLKTLADGSLMAAWLQPLTAVENFDGDNARIYYSIWSGPTTDEWSDPVFIPRDLAWTPQTLGSTLSNPDDNGLIVGDFTGDGFDEVIQQKAGSVNLLRSNQANGSFTTTTLNESDFELSDNKALLTGDFNGDGLDDVLLQNQSDTLKLFLANPESETGFEAPRSLSGFDPSLALPDVQLVAGDFNGDGLTDFLAQNTASSTPTVTPYLNRSEGTTFEFKAQTPLSPGEAQQPILITGDFNGDGLDDFLFNSQRPGDTLKLYLADPQNPGTFQDAQNTSLIAATVQFEEKTGSENPFDGLVVESDVVLTRPTFGDLDGDGDQDGVVGTGSGEFSYLENTGDDDAPNYVERTGADNPFNDFNAPLKKPIKIAPFLVDINGDSLLDVVVGNDNGTLNYYKNTGSASNPAFTQQTDSDNPFEAIAVQNLSTPALADIDGDGDVDLVVGSNDNPLEYYENTGTATAPNYVQRTGGDNPFNDIDAAPYSAPALADIDGDGDFDLAIGSQVTSGNNTYYGQIVYYENTGDATNPTYTQRTGAANPFNDLNQVKDSENFTPAPAFLNNQTAVIGNFSGGLSYSPINAFSYAYAAADLNADGISDLVQQETYNVTSLNTVTALIAKGDGTFIPRAEPTALLNSSTLVNLVVGNFDGGADDFITQGATSSDITQTFTTQVESPDVGLGLQTGELDGQPTFFWQRSQEPAYAITVLGDSPVIYYRLQESSGSSAAINYGSLGTPYDGAYNGSISLDQTGALVPGDYDTAAAFDGGSLTVDNSNEALPTEGFSVEFWANFTEANGSITITQDWEIDLSASSFKTTLTAPNTNTSTTPDAEADINLPTGQWHHVVVSYEPGFTLSDPDTGAITDDIPTTLTLYVDAQAVATKTFDDSYERPVEGNDLTLTATGVTLDEFALYDYGLLEDSTVLAGQIATHFTAQQNEFDFAQSNIYQTVVDAEDGTANTSQVEPLADPTPTQLSVERGVEFDIVSPDTLAPNGVTDRHFVLTLDKNSAGEFNQGLLGREIVGILLTDTTTKTTWAVGEVSGNSDGNILGVTQGRKLLNNIDPSDTSFSHTIVGLEETFEFYVDPVSGTKDSDSYEVTFFFGEGDPSTFALPAVDSQAVPATGDVDEVSLSQAKPNGIPDLAFELNIAGQAGQKIATIELTQTSILQFSDKPDNKVTNTWDSDGTGEFLGVALNDQFQNGGSTLYTFGQNENLTFNLFADPQPVDTQGGTVIGTTYAAKVTFANNDTLTQQVSPIGADFIASGSVLESAPTDLSEIDSGIILTGVPGDGEETVSGLNSLGQTAAAGNFDNEGQGDLALGVPGYDQRQGGVLVLLSGDGQLEAEDITPGEPASNSVWIAGFANQENDSGETYGIGAGYSLVSGNIDGDDLTDLVIGAPYADVDTTGDAKGKVYVVYGKALQANQGQTIDLSEVESDASLGFMIEGQADGEQFGTAIAVGNVDGTGNDEIVIGAPKYSDSTDSEGNALYTGRVYLYTGEDDTGTLTPIFTGSTTEPVDTSGNQSTVGDQAGSSVAVSEAKTNDKPADFNGDGFADILIGSPYVYGKYYAYASNLDTINDVNSSFTQFYGGLQQSSPNTDFSTGKTTYSFRSGEAYVVYGAESLTDLSKGDLSGSQNGVVLETSLDKAGDVGTGYAVSFTGDINGDGYDDAAVGAPDRNYRQGATFIVKGRKSDGFTGSVDLTTQSDNTIIGPTSNSQTGSGISSAGDVNNDGINDLLVASPFSGYAAGQTHVIFGDSKLSADIQLSPSAQSGVLVLNGGNPKNFSGRAVSGAGDINGDTIDDLVVTAPQVAETYIAYGKDYLRDDGSIKLSQLRDDNGFALEFNSFTQAIPRNFITINKAGNLLLTTGGAPEVIVKVGGSSDNIPYQAVMLDGNLGIFNSIDNQPIYRTQTNSPGAFVSLATDGGVYIRDKDGAVIKTLKGANSENTNYSTLALGESIISPLTSDEGDEYAATFFITNEEEEENNRDGYLVRLRFVGTDDNGDGILSGRGSSSSLSPTITNELTDWEMKVVSQKSSATATYNLSQQLERADFNFNFDLNTQQVLATDNFDVFSPSTDDYGLNIGIPGKGDNTFNLFSFAADQDIKLQLNGTVVAKTPSLDSSFINTSLASLASPGSVTVRGSAYSLRNPATLGDVNGDGYDDILRIDLIDDAEYANQQSAVVELGGNSKELINESAFGLTTLTAADGPITANGGDVIGDFNGDGLADLLLNQNDTLSLFLGNPLALQEADTTTAYDATSDTISRVATWTSVGVNGEGTYQVILKFEGVDNDNNGILTGRGTNSSIAGDNELTAWELEVLVNGDSRFTSNLSEQQQLQEFNFNFDLTTEQVLANSSESNFSLSSNEFGLKVGTSGSPEAGTFWGLSTTDNGIGLFESTNNNNSPDLLQAATLLGQGRETPSFNRSSVVDVSPIGDVNGDGYDDLAIVTTTASAETAYVVYGNAKGSLPNDLTSMDESEGFTVSGTNGKFRNATRAGDLNGDGFDDLVIGWTYNYSIFSPPITGVILGERNRNSLNLGPLNNPEKINQDLRAANVFAFSNDNGNRTKPHLSGNVVAGLGDVNGDGFDDLALNFIRGANQIPGGISAVRVTRKNKDFWSGNPNTNGLVDGNRPRNLTKA
jgi:hypothetical protein